MWGWLFRAPAVPIMRVRGIPVEAHWSLLISILINANLLAATRYLGRYPGLSQTTITAMTLVSVLLLPASILLHELGHLFQSRREGAGAERITLWAFGGVAWGGPARTWSGYIRIVAAGPLVSLVLAGLLGGLGWLGESLGWPDAVVGVAVLLAQVNVWLFAFNLLPIRPLDGGQLLYGALQRLRGPVFADTQIKRVGVGLASLLIAYGLIGPFADTWPYSQLPQSVALNSAIMFQGVFVLWLTLTSPPAARPRRRGLVIGDLLAGPPDPGVAVGPEQTIGHFLESPAGAQEGYGACACPVLDGGRTVGAISPGLAQRVPADRRAYTTVAEVMLGKADSVVIEREAPLENAFHALQRGSGQGVVLNGKRVAGIILASDLADALLRVKDMERGIERR